MLPVLPVQIHGYSQHVLNAFGCNYFIQIQDALTVIKINGTNFQPGVNKISGEHYIQIVQECNM